MTLRGFATVNYWADDLAGARKWYSELLGVEPYLGIVDRRWAPPGTSTAPGGAIMYWHVDDVRGTVEKLLAMGATEHRPVTERGPGFVTASVVDPFGNILGVMYNRHYVEQLAQ
ncbi:MAG: hypothetical protein AUG44_16250 [Actinobacteria bacterium 13_1_20CM_3_71_11]|nr:MAG: hypothetical protein AUG44_16250 [Actinobacteria bacterium 13_1_20CM_3_71_11]